MFNYLSGSNFNEGINKKHGLTMIGDYFTKERDQS